MKVSKVIDFFSQGFQRISGNMFKAAINKATNAQSVNLGNDLQKAIKQKPKSIPK